MTAVSTRLVRLLNMVPYFQANPKITYTEAASDRQASRQSRAPATGAALPMTGGPSGARHDYGR